MILNGLLVSFYVSKIHCYLVLVPMIILIKTIPRNYTENKTKLRFIVPSYGMEH